MSDPASPPTEMPKTPRRKRGWFLLMVGLFNALWALLVLCLVAAVGAVYFLYDRPVVIPAWAEARIEHRLKTKFPQVEITFGEVRLVMEEGWRPRVRLRDVAVSTPEGAEVVRFSEARIGLSLDALRSGTVQPSSVALRGVFVSLLREEDGTISLQTDLAGAAGRSTSFKTPGAVVAAIDTVLSQPGLAALATAELRGLTLQYVDRRAGRAFTVDGGRLIAARAQGVLSATADLALLGDSAQATTLSANFSSKIGEVAAQFGVVLGDATAADIASQSPAFAWMGALRAPISGAVRSGVLPNGTLAPLSATLQIGSGVVQPNENTRPIPFAGARSYFRYEAASGLLHFDELSVDSDWITARANGTATLTGLRDGSLDAMVGQFAITQLRADPMSLYPQPVELEGAEIDFRLQTAPFQLDIGRIDVFDAGNIHTAFGALVAEPEGWRLSVDAHTDTISPQRILALWPEAAKPKTRNWLVANLISADITDADFALRIAPGAAARSYMAFNYHAAKVKFLRHLPPITQARGHAELDGKRFVVAVDDGRVVAEEGGTVHVTQSAFIIPDLAVKDGTPAVVRLNARAPLTAALWALDQPPIQAMQRAGLPVQLGQGEVAARGTLAFPLKRGGSPADIVFDVTGEVRDVRSETLIKGRLLQSDRMEIVASNKAVEISGPGTLDGVAFDGAWTQPIGTGSGKSALRGTARLTKDALDAFGVALPEEMVAGGATARIGIDFERGQAPRMTLKSDLRGATLRIPQLGWTKSSAARGQLDMALRLGAQPEVTSIALSGGGLEAQGRVTLGAGGGLGQLDLERLRVGDWLDVRAALVGTGAGRPPQVVVSAGRLDLRRAEFGSGGGDAANGPAGARAAAPMQVRLDRLQITDKIGLEQLSGTFQTTGGLDGAFTARVNGNTPVSGRVVPQRGRTAVRLQSPDAGGVLRSAQLARQVVGGTLDLSLLPVGSGNAFDGRLRIDGISIKDAPSMAALVNSLSVVGLVNEMNGDGIYFDEVEAEFRLTPGRITLSRGSAVGASLGLSMDGAFATDTGQIAMQGVITPVYLLNGVGSLLTRKGEGLLGFNYALSGRATSPQVSINPLSVLAPGALRNVFRGPQTEVPTVEGEVRRAPPENPSRPVEPAYEGR